MNSPAIECLGIDNEERITLPDQQPAHILDQFPIRVESTNVVRSDSVMPVPVQVSIAVERHRRQCGALTNNDNVAVLCGIAVILSHDDGSCRSIRICVRRRMLELTENSTHKCRG